MQPDDELCYCQHVSLRKLLAFARRERPARASQMTECLGAGSACGWCVPFLKKIADNPDDNSLVSVSPEEYAEQRQAYRSSGQPRNKF